MTDTQGSNLAKAIVETLEKGYCTACIGQVASPVNALCAVQNFSGRLSGIPAHSHHA